MKRPPISLWWQDQRISGFLLIWATVCTFILLIQGPSSRGALRTTVVHDLAKNCPEHEWHGGNPSDKKFVGGSCWCGQDKYCMCTPSLAIDAIIEVVEDQIYEKFFSSKPPDVALPVAATTAEFAQSNVSIILVKRKDPPKDKYAITGGFVDVGESVENATIREVKEETNIDLTWLQQFHVYSDPSRDSRRHTVSAVHRCVIKQSQLSTLKKGSDAKAVAVLPLNRGILDLNLAFDHRQVLHDYMMRYHRHLLLP